MRTTVAYTLRLLVDETEPRALRGVLRDVTSGEERSFSSVQGLLELLYPHVDPTPEATDASEAVHTGRSDA